MTKKKILMIVSSPSVHTTMNYPVGFWAAELTHPYHAFTEAGYEITIASPKGGKVIVDGLSDPSEASGYSAHDTLSRGYLNNPKFLALLENTAKVSDMKALDYDALVVCGGQGPMFTFKDEPALHKLFASFYESGKITAALCHGTSVFLYSKLSNGEYLVKDKVVTGFANSEEDYADQYVGAKLMPFRIEDEARKLGAYFITHRAFHPFAIRDGNLITGQQQNSGAEVARVVIEALGK